MLLICLKTFFCGNNHKVNILKTKSSCSHKEAIHPKHLEILRNGSKDNYGLYGVDNVVALLIIELSSGDFHLRLGTSGTTEQWPLDHTHLIVAM